MRHLFLILLTVVFASSVCYSQSGKDSVVGRYELLETEFDINLPDCGFVLVGFMNTYKDVESGTVYRFFHLCPEQYSDVSFDVGSFYNIKSVKKDVEGLKKEGLIYNFKDEIDSIYVVKSISLDN